MDRKELLREIKAHCKATGESPYMMGKRLLGDKAFYWKLKNHNREPWERTVKKIMDHINREKKRRG